MRKIFFVLLAFALLFSMVPSASAAQEVIKFDFEDGEEGWKIPDWELEREDYKAKTSGLSSKVASSGENSLEVICDYPGITWTAALVEREKNLDLTGYKSISVDVYIPKGAPRGLFVGRVILTVGDGWWFLEQKEAIPLEVGKWTTITASLDDPDLTDRDSLWRGRKEKRLYQNIDKIKKIAVRVEYDAAPPTRVGPRYYGPIYVDNVVIE